MKQMNKIYTGLGLSTSLICCTLIPKTFPIAYATNVNETAVVLSANENSTENTGTTTDPGTAGNIGESTTDPGTAGNTGGSTTDPGTGGSTGGTTNPGTGGNTGGTTTDPGTSGNTGGTTTDPGTDGNTGGTTDPITEGNTTSPNIGNGVVVPNTQKPINSNVSEQAGIPTSNNEQQNLNTSEGSEPVDQTSLLPKTGGEKTNAFELSLLTSVTSVIFTTILRLKMKKGGDVQ